MKIDSKLKKVLVEKMENYRERVPVYRIEHKSFEFHEKRAMDLARRFLAVHGLKQERVSAKRSTDRITLQLPENARLNVYPVSGAVTAESGWNPMQRLVSTDAKNVDKELLTKKVHEAVERLGLYRFSSGKDELRFERLWQLKASGITDKGEQGDVVVSRVVGAFRRYITDIPVWGRASVFTKLAQKGQLDAFGVDWRPVNEDPLAWADVIDPEDGAKRVLEELQTTLPGGSFTVEDFEPELFSMGYLSLPKRRAQTVMQPVWVAMLRARGWTSMSHLIVVPALTTPYESICRPIQLPPLEKVKPIGRISKP
jgi:hypothetical protein